MKRATRHHPPPPPAVDRGEMDPDRRVVRKVPPLTQGQAAFHSGTSDRAAFSVDAALKLYDKHEPAK